MNFIQLLGIERIKVKRSKMLPLILIPPILVIVSGVANLSFYFTPEYTNAWQAMFIQSALLFGYYLLPFSMVVICAMLVGRETQNNGILKMLALPISPKLMSIAKFVVLLGWLFLEIVVFFFVFLITGMIAVKTTGITESLPIFYLLKWSMGLFLTSIPSVALMWAITVLFENQLLSIGLNMLLVIPGVLAANTPIWILYPYCYSGYLVSCAMNSVTGGITIAFRLFPFIQCAFIIFGLSLWISAYSFGRKEMK